MKSRCSYSEWVITVSDWTPRIFCGASKTLIIMKYDTKTEVTTVKPTDLMLQMSQTEMWLLWSELRRQEEPQIWPSNQIYKSDSPVQQQILSITRREGFDRKSKQKPWLFLKINVIVCSTPVTPTRGTTDGNEPCLYSCVCLGSLQFPQLFWHIFQKFRCSSLNNFYNLQTVVLG